MEESDYVPQVKVFSTANKSTNFLMSPEVTIKQIFYANPRHGRVMQSNEFHYCPQRGETVSHEFRRQPADDELLQRREAEARGATAVGVDLHHQPPETTQKNTRGKCCCCYR